MPQQRIRDYIINSEVGKFDFPFVAWSPLMIQVDKADNWLDNNPNVVPIRGIKSLRPQRNKKNLRKQKARLLAGFFCFIIVISIIYFFRHHREVLS